jgi:hypothetical protein
MKTFYYDDKYGHSEFTTCDYLLQGLFIQTVVHVDTEIFILSQRHDAISQRQVQKKKRKKNPKLEKTLKHSKNSRKGGKNMQKAPEDNKRAVKIFHPNRSNKLQPALPGLMLMKSRKIWFS